MNREIRELTSFLQTILVIFGIGALVYQGLNQFSLIKIEGFTINEKNLKIFLSLIVTSIFISLVVFFIMIKKISRQIKKIIGKRSFISPLALFVILAIIFVVMMLLIRGGIL